MKAFHTVLLFVALGVATCLFERQNVFVSISLPWPNAQEYCRKHYVDLSVFTSNGNLNKIKNLGYSSSSSWIGLSKSPNEFSYSKWSDGTKLTFTAWNVHEPNDLVNSHCVFLYSAMYFDHNCSVPLTFYCYYWIPQIIVVKEMMDWEQALMYCRNNYEDLLGIDTDTETDVLVVNQSLINQTTSVWTGLRFMDGLWFWVNKETMMDWPSLPACPAKPFQCGAFTTDKVFENMDCNKKMDFLCY